MIHSSTTTETDCTAQQDQIIVDIIVLGCSLPGMVTAHKLKRRFGNTMEIVILDLVQSAKSKTAVAFEADDDESEEYTYDESARQVFSNLAKFYLNMFAKEFNIILPVGITDPDRFKTNLSKVFEHKNGKVVTYSDNLHDFEYLSWIEKIELNQYHRLLEEYMKDLFQAGTRFDEVKTGQLLYYDHTTMEQHICYELLFPTSREIMRNIVRLVCGVPPNDVSLLFYLHRCYRTGSVKNHLDGKNTRLREKLVGYCRRAISKQLLKSNAHITLSTKKIKEISSFTDEKVILRTLTGNTSYVCNLLAMALKPDELSNIHFASELVSKTDKALFSTMKKGKVRKFVIQYEENFWHRKGFSGDIFSVRGPIIWAIERPEFEERENDDDGADWAHNSTLMGFIEPSGENVDSVHNVNEQLLRLFGVEAATVVHYYETDIKDIYVPLCGNFIDLRQLIYKSRHEKLEWGALDIFDDGDLASCLEAGHNAYLHLLNFLRPQAQTYEDLRVASWPIFLNDVGPFKRWGARFNVSTGVRLAVYGTITYVGICLVRHYFYNNH